MSAGRNPADRVLVRALGESAAARALRDEYKEARTVARIRDLQADARSRVGVEAHTDDCMCDACTAFCSMCQGLCRAGSAHREYHTTSDAHRAELARRSR